MNSESKPKPNRHQRRRLAVQTRAGQAPVTEPTGNEKERLRKLEVTLEMMRVAFNRNHKAYASAIGAADGQFAVLRAVINDIHRDVRALREYIQDRLPPLANESNVIPGETAVTPLVTDEKTGDVSGGDISWEGYYAMYNEYQERLQAEEAAAKKAEAEASAAGAILAIDALPPTTEEIFGGDYGGGNRPVSESSAHTNGAPG